MKFELLDDEEPSQTYRIYFATGECLTAQLTERDRDDLQRKFGQWASGATITSLAAINGERSSAELLRQRSAEILRHHRASLSPENLRRLNEKEELMAETSVQKLIKLLPSVEKLDAVLRRVFYLSTGTLAFGLIAIIYVTYVYVSQK